MFHSCVVLFMAAHAMDQPMHVHIVTLTLIVSFSHQMRDYCGNFYFNCHSNHAFYVGITLWYGTCTLSY